MDNPDFRLLKDNENRRARIITIRNAISPLLASNYLAHFTDHSIEHSDRVCGLVDQLASSLDPTKPITSIEAAVLYGACYFHDAGMQHARAGDTEKVNEVLQAEYGGQRWSSLNLETQQNIVRKYHNYISAELVRRAIRTGDPALGITLNDEDRPGIVASLCRAHCLTTDGEEYRSDTADQAEIRVGLLSALLRLADILDESRRRSHLHLEQTRELPLLSRLHWWRHYYVSDIVVESRAITLWFDFPPERRAQYKELIEPIQIPSVEAEFKRHWKVLADNGLSWNLTSRDTPVSQCTAKVMDDELERYAVEQFVKARDERLRRERTEAANQLRVARPTIERQFAGLRDSTDGPDEQIAKAIELADHLGQIGGRRDAWTRLRDEFSRLKTKVNEAVRLDTAIRIAELMLDDDASESAWYSLQEFAPHFVRLPEGDVTRIRFLRVWAQVLRDRGAYAEAVSAFCELATTGACKAEQEKAMAEIDEMHLLQGELSSLKVDPDETC